MTGQLDASTIEHRIPHAAKWEGCLVWPGPSGAAFAPQTRVRLYERGALSGVVAACRAAGRAVTFREVEESGAAYLAETFAERDGYFYFAEASPEEDPGEILWFERIAEWPASPTRYYLAIEGCAVCAPVVSVNEARTPAAKNDHAGSFLLDPAELACLAELEIYEALDERGRRALWWRVEAAAAGKSELSRDAEGRYRTLVDAQFGPRKATPPLPGESIVRLRPIPVVAVVPLLALDNRAADATKHHGADRWTSHPSLDTKIVDAVRHRFNESPGAPKLRNGLNVDKDGAPLGRPPVLPRAVLDLRRCPAPDEVLASVRVAFFQYGIRLGGKKTTLEHFARASREQIAFGDGECLATHVACEGASRIRLTRAKAGPEVLDVAAPLMPQFTANVDAAAKEVLYEPLRWVSGGHFLGGVGVDCKLTTSGGKPTAASIDKYFEWPDGDATDVATVRALSYYHRDLFRVGCTGGVFTSSRSNPSGYHLGIDFYNFARHEQSASAPAARGEIIHASFTGLFSTGDSGLVLERVLSADQSVRLEHMHAAPGSAPGLEHVKKSEKQLVFRGEVLGTSGASGNAEGADVLSKHLHMYAYVNKPRADVASFYGGGSCDVAAVSAAGAEISKAYHDAYNAKFAETPNLAPGPRKAGAKAAGDVPKNQKRTAKNDAFKAADPDWQANHYPVATGKVPAAKKPVKVFLCTRVDGALVEIVAVTKPTATGRFAVHVPPDLDTRLVVAYADDDPTDATKQLAWRDLTLAAAASYQSEAHALGTLTLTEP